MKLRTYIPAPSKIRVRHAVPPEALPIAARLRFHGFDSGGSLQVQLRTGELVACDLMENVDPQGWQPGEVLLVLLEVDGGRPVVMGAVVARPRATDQADLRLTAQKSVTLACGEASLTLRADGKVLLKGDDVVVHAKGTQRIRAGTVAIN